VGDEVEVGQVVALVEAMKAFNEIRSELAGTVEKILVAPGQVLRAGQALIQLRPRPVGGEGG
jgi:acetyl-CoA carboxylase biotin carboxyl carrier protein